MRVNLTVPYEQRHEAKSLGARWDVSRKVWYVTDPPDMEPFMRWYKEPAWKKKPKTAGKVTPRTDFSLPDCDCSTPPWEECEHTAFIDPRIYAL